MLKDVIAEHQAWLAGDNQAQQGRFAKKDLSEFSFSGMDLRNFIIRQSDIRECDFSGADLTGATFLKNEGTGAVFTGANVTGVDFLKSEFSSLIGALWNGQEIKMDFDTSIQDHYWCGVNNLFIQVGCYIGTFEELIAKNSEELMALDKENPEMPALWLDRNRDVLQQLVEQYAIL